MQTSNGLRSLTGQQLMHNSVASTFGRITPAGAPGVDTPHAWYESGIGRDGLTYTSPELPLTAQAMVCESDSALVAWWMDNSDNINLPASTDWVPGPTIMTSACPGVSPPPAPSGNRSVSDARVGTGSVATGWPTEVQALSATGQINELYYWYGGGWDNSGSDWYFYAKRNLTCPSGERVVNGSCQTCPTYDDCSGGTLTTKTWCNYGNPPADDRRVSYRSCVSNVTVTEWACVDASDPDPTDQPCVVVCGPGERDGGGFCEPCPTYRTCDASGNLSTQTWCNAGSPPGDARVASYQSCQGGSTVTLQACVDNGGTVPPDAPCVNCPAGQRLVAGSCQPCPTYRACNDTADSIGRRGSSQVEWCQAGNPPPDSTTGSFQTCQGSTLVTAYTCVDATHSLPANATWCPKTIGDCTAALGYSSRPIPPDNRYCERCPTYETCVGNTIRTRSWCDPGDPPGDGQYDYYQACSNGATVNRRVCLDPGETVPADNPCSSCPSGQRLVSGSCEACPTYQACSGNSLVTQTYCGSGNPPADATQASYQSCQGGSTVTLQACLLPGESAPADNPCPTSCPSGQRLVSGVCETCPEYWTCSGTNRVQRDWCNSGSPPADSWTTTYQGCRSGSTVTLNACVEGGDPAPADAPCTTCPSGQRLVSGSCETCPTYLTCQGGNLRNTDWCNTGSPPADAYKTTYEACQSGVTVDLEACVDGGGSPPDDAPCTGCLPGQRLVAGSCETCPTYLMCDGGSPVRTSWCDPGNPPSNTTTYRYKGCVSDAGPTEWRSICGSNPPTDAAMVEYQDCVNSVTVTLQACVGEDGLSSAPDDAPCGTPPPPPPPPPPQTYEACLNGVVTTETWTGNGNPVDDPIATRYYCVGAAERTALICASTDDDDKPRSCGAGYSFNADDCCERDTVTQTYEACSNGVVTVETWTGSGTPVDDPTATRYYCVGANERTATICASTDDDDKPRSCANGYSLNDVDCCEEDRTYLACSNGVVTTEPWTGSGPPVNDDTATRYFCNGATPDDELICASSDRNDKPRSCGTGYSFNDDDCCEQDPPPIPNGTEKYCDSNGVAKERTASGTDDVDNLDKASDCTSRQILNSDSCCVPLGTKYYCDSNGVAQESLTSGIADINNLDKASDCTSQQTLNSDSCCEDPPPRGIETYCDSNGNVQERDAPGTDNVNNLDKASDCRNGESLNNQSCCVVCPPTRKNYCSTGQDWEWNTTTCSWDEVDVDPDACYNRSGYTYVYDTWLATACDYTTTSSVDLEPTAGTCETVDWSTASCGWVTTDNTPTDPGGCPGQGQAWDRQGCEYVAVNVPPIACDGTLEWQQDCTWDCIILEIEFSFPSLISEQTSAATYEQNLDLTFNSDGSITLIENLVGPNSTTTTSLGNWATGADVAQVSSVVEYRLALTDWGTCPGSSGWSPFSGLALGVFGEAHVGQTAISCNYEFRDSKTYVGLGSSRIQLSTQAGGTPGNLGP